MVIRTKHIFKESWKQPQEVTDLVKKYLESPVLNICCGKADIGDLRADVTLSVEPDMICDVFNMPFKHGSFASLYCDPPWNLGYPQRIKLTKELGNVIKPGGRLIMNCPWVPTCKGLKIEELYVLHHHYCHQNVTLLTISRKVNQILDSY